MASSKPMRLNRKLMITFACFVLRNPPQVLPARCFRVTLSAKPNVFGATTGCLSFYPSSRNCEPFPKALVFRSIDNFSRRLQVIFREIADASLRLFSQPQEAAAHPDC